MYASFRELLMQCIILWVCMHNILFFQAPDSYKNVTDVVNTCKLIEHCCAV